MTSLKPWFLASAFLGFAYTGHASTIAIIDSGMDYKHNDLKDHVWTNEKDPSFDGLDDDENGIIDDVHGMNFIERNGNIIDYKFGRFYNEEIAKFFTLQSKALEGLATPEEIEYLSSKVKDQKFLKTLSTYANYAHGTHVAGISASLSPQNQLITLKLIPTQSPFSRLETQIKSSLAEGKEFNWIIKNIIKIGLSLLAEAQGMVFGEVGKTVHDYGAQIANASLGLGPTQAKMLLTPLLTLANRGQAPSQDLVNEMVSHLLKEVSRTQKKIALNAPNTLFVFAAGNDGSNNDLFPTAPASIDHPNVLSVAATNSKGALAPFSNYGKKVSVAAPGVGIEAPVPDQRRLILSGTSQAAPYVAGLAGALLDTNPALTPMELKKIIVETTDPMLPTDNRQVASGLVNRDRALLAAEYSLKKGIKASINQAIKDIPVILPTLDFGLEIGASQAPYAGPIFQPSLF